MVSRRLAELARPLGVPAFRRLFAAQVVSQLGDWAARLAVALLVLDKTGSAALTGLAMALTLLPWVGIGQLLAVVADHLDRRRVMVACDVARAGIFLLMGLVELPVGVVLALAFVAGLFDPPFEATRSALVPVIVGRSLYGDALTVGTIADQVALLAGYALGGGLVAWLGAMPALVVNGATFAVSAALLAGLPSLRAVAPGGRFDLVVRCRAVVDVLRVDRVLRMAVFGFVPIAFGAMAAESLAPVYVTRQAGGGPGMVGLALAAVPVGTIAATFAVRSHGDAAALLRRVGGLAVAGAVVGCVLFALGTGLPLVLVAYGAVGVVFASSVPANTLAGWRIPDASRAGVFSILQGLVLGSQALGALVGGLTAGAVSAVFASSAALLLAAAVGLFVLRTARRTVVVPLVP